MPKRPSDQSDNGDTRASADIKRKLQARPVLPTTDAAKQQTISELFTASKQRSSTKGNTELPRTPSKKRRRVTYDSSPPPRSGDSGLGALSPNKMYNFPSRNATNGSTSIIDLTGSSPAASPQKNNNARSARPTNPSLGPKKLIVKNLRPTAKSDPTQYLNSVWEKLDVALTAIFARDDASQTFPFSMEELYKGVENVCKQSKEGAKELCTRMQEKSRSYIVTGLKAPLLDRLNETSIDVLRAVIGAWKRWNEQLVSITASLREGNLAYHCVLDHRTKHLLLS